MEQWDAIFEVFYYYPCLNDTSCPLAVCDLSVSAALPDLITNGVVAFDTDGGLKMNFSWPQLVQAYDTEFSGIFVRKSFLESTASIPKKIHQIWLGDKRAPQEFIDTWPQLNPGWEHILWDEDMLRDCFPAVEKMRISELRDPYDYPCKSDLYRLHVLNRDGGVYVDTDCKCLKPLTDEFCRHNFFATFECEQRRGLLINNCVVGAVPNNIVINTMLERLRTYSDNKIAEIATVNIAGPGFYTEIFQANPQLDFFVYPSYYFKRDYVNTCENNPRENSFLNQFAYADHVGRYDAAYLQAIEGEVSCNA